MAKSLKNKSGVEEYACLLKNFYGELCSYAIVNAGLVLIWLLTGAGYFWPIWPIVVWGISLLIKASKLEIIDHSFYEQCDTLREKFLFLKKDWEEEKIQQILDKVTEKDTIFKEASAKDCTDTTPTDKGRPRKNTAKKTVKKLRRKSQRQK